MIRIFLIRFILPLIAFLVIRYLVKSIWGSYRASVPASKGESENVRAGGELKRDPVCGTYVAAASAFTRVVDGRPVYFCSTACRDKYHSA
jgi:YHS domain-containing protein